jgi:hypothetical protein
MFPFWKMVDLGSGERYERENELEERYKYKISSCS